MSRPPQQPPVLVVGGTSFIGHHALPRLVAAGARVVATCRDAGITPPVRHVEWVQTDLASATPTEHWPGEIETLVYLAQSRGWREFPAGARDVFDVNIRGVVLAAEYARQRGCRRFIHLSTGSVYQDGPASERQVIDAQAPRHFYVAAKLSAEMLLAPYAPTMQVVVLRLFVPYGGHQDTRMLLPQIVEKVRAGEPVQLDGADGLTANPVAASDVGEVIVRCRQLTTSGTFNVAGPEVVTLRQIAEQVGATVGRSPRFEARDRPAPNLVGVTDRLAAVLGWTPPTPLSEGLRHWLSTGADAGGPG